MDDILGKRNIKVVVVIKVGGEATRQWKFFQVCGGVFGARIEFFSKSKQPLRCLIVLVLKSCLKIGGSSRFEVLVFCIFLKCGWVEKWYAQVFKKGFSHNCQYNWMNLLPSIKQFSVCLHAYYNCPPKTCSVWCGWEVLRAYFSHNLTGIFLSFVVARSSLEVCGSLSTSRHVKTRRDTEVCSAPHDGRTSSCSPRSHRARTISERFHILGHYWYCYLYYSRILYSCHLTALSLRHKFCIEELFLLRCVALRVWFAVHVSGRGKEKRRRVRKVTNASCCSIVRAYSPQDASQ